MERSLRLWLKLQYFKYFDSMIKTTRLLQSLWKLNTAILFLHSLRVIITINNRHCASASKSLR